jgi:hypothetical protein
MYPYFATDTSFSAQAFYRFNAIRWVDWEVEDVLGPLNEQLLPRDSRTPTIMWDTAGFHDIIGKFYTQPTKPAGQDDPRVYYSDLLLERGIFHSSQVVRFYADRENRYRLPYRPLTPQAGPGGAAGRGRGAGPGNDYGRGGGDSGQAGGFGGGSGSGRGGSSAQGSGYGQGSGYSQSGGYSQGGGYGRGSTAAEYSSGYGRSSSSARDSSVANYASSSASNRSSARSGATNYVSSSGRSSGSARVSNPAYVSSSGRSSTSRHRQGSGQAGAYEGYTATQPGKGYAGGAVYRVETRASGR